MAISLGGLASGFDTDSVVAQLMAAERLPRIRKQQDEQLARSRQNALRDVSTRLRNLQNAARDLGSVALWAPKQAVESSDPTKAAVRSTGPAAAGGYALNVTQLARAEQRAFTYAASAVPSTVTVNGRDYAMAADADLQSLVDQINGDSAGTVFASKVEDRLVLSSKVTGAGANGTGLNITASSSEPSALSEDTTRQRAGRRAEYTVDGGSARYSDSNVVTDAVVGVEVTLKSAGASTVNVGGPAVDNAAVAAKARAFVEQYNSAVDFMRSKVQEKRVTKPTTDAERLQGALRSDTGLNSVLSQLRSTMTQSVATGNLAMDELAELGITTGAATGASAVSADALAGKLVFDEAKFTKALAEKGTDVRKVLGGTAGTTGLSGRIEALLDPLVQPTTGVLPERMKGFDSEIGRIKSAMDNIDSRLAAREKRYRAQFAAMERALAASQSTQSFLSSQLRLY